MTRTARRPTTDAHLQRKPPEKLRAGGLHSIKDTASTFGRIKPTALSPAAHAASQNNPTPRRNQTRARDYTFPEVAPNTCRPGAMDAFHKPSRVGQALLAAIDEQLAIYETVIARYVRTGRAGFSAAELLTARAAASVFDGLVKLDRAQSLRSTPSAASFAAYASLRFAALAAVSTAA